MSLSHDGTLHDFFDGRSDLAAGRVRFVGDPLRRIEEDGLRILRFFRFQARYGDGAPDAQALSAIAARLSCLAPLSAERIWSELERLLAGPSPARRPPRCSGWRR
jgi:poly(A) polymerase